MRTCHCAHPWKMDYIARHFNAHSIWCSEYTQYQILHERKKERLHRTLAGTRAARVTRSARASASASASASEHRKMRRERYVCTYRVATIGPRKGNIAAGGRGRHGGGEPLCCVLRATKTMRRHEAARDAPRRLYRSSYTQVPRRTHYVHAPSSGDDGLKRRCEEGTEESKKKIHKLERWPGLAATSQHARTHACMHDNPERPKGRRWREGGHTHTHSSSSNIRHETPGRVFWRW